MFAGQTPERSTAPAARARCRFRPGWHGAGGLGARRLRRRRRGCPAEGGHDEHAGHAEQHSGGGCGLLHGCLLRVRVGGWMGRWVIGRHRTWGRATCRSRVAAARRTPGTRRCRAARTTVTAAYISRMSLELLAYSRMQLAEALLAPSEEEVADDGAHHRQPGRDAQPGEHRRQRRREHHLAQPREPPTVVERDQVVQAGITRNESEQGVEQDREDRDQHAHDDA